MKTKHFKVLIEDPLDQYNFKKRVLCQDTEVNEFVRTVFPEEESDSNLVYPLWPVSLLSDLKVRTR